MTDASPTDRPLHAAPTTRAWWRSAVIYQIYPRSFADADGDGYGDLPGITRRLPYLRDVGVDAVWISPFYPSPQADAGYDVANYHDVDPLFGSLADADDLIGTAHQLGLRVMVDLVPNHTSDEHPWFQQALAAGPGSSFGAGERRGFRSGGVAEASAARTVRRCTPCRSASLRIDSSSRRASRRIASNSCTRVDPTPGPLQRREPILTPDTTEPGHTRRHATPEMTSGGARFDRHTHHRPHEWDQISPSSRGQVSLSGSR